jgi:uncharacterized protein YlxW (UPF0749 family)
MTEDTRPGAAGPGRPEEDEAMPHPFGPGSPGERPGAEDPEDPAEPLAPTEQENADPDGGARKPVLAEEAAEPAEADADAARETTEEVTGTEVGAPAPGPGAGRRRRRDPLAAVLIGVLALLLGFAFAVQVRSVGEDQQYAGAREEDLVRILDELNAREDRLRQQIADQRSALQQLSSSDSQSDAALEEARRRAEAIGILNGTIAARGPGLVMTVRDPEDTVRVADILDAIQELRGAGAETMQIDGVRVGVSTAVTGDPGDLMVDGRPITAPYEFRVIGSPQNMETAMNIPGGAVSRFTNRGGTVTITQSDDVVVDALRPLDTPQYASPETSD